MSLHHNAVGNALETLGHLAEHRPPPAVDLRRATGKKHVLSHVQAQPLTQLFDLDLPRGDFRFQIGEQPLVGPAELVHLADAGGQLTLAAGQSLGEIRLHTPQPRDLRIELLLGDPQIFEFVEELCTLSIEAPGRGFEKLDAPLESALVRDDPIVPALAHAAGGGGDRADQRQQRAESPGPGRAAVPDRCEQRARTLGRECARAPHRFAPRIRGRAPSGVPPPPRPRPAGCAPGAPPVRSLHAWPPGSFP